MVRTTLLALPLLICCAQTTAQVYPGGYWLQAKVNLEGAYDPNTGTMRTDLVANGLVPLVEPYTSAGYPAMGGTGETTTPFWLDSNVVDWVQVELRSAADPTVVEHTLHGLVHADGDIVMPQQGCGSYGSGNAVVDISATSGTDDPLITPWPSAATGKVRHQYLFRADELVVAMNQVCCDPLATTGLCAGEPINSISFYVDQAVTNTRTGVFSVALFHSSLSALNAFDDQPSSGVCVALPSPQPSVGGAGWRTFTFATPFVWNGMDNVVVEVGYAAAQGPAAAISVLASGPKGFNCTYGRYAPLSETTCPINGMCGMTGSSNCGSGGPTDRRPVVRFNGVVETAGIDCFLPQPPAQFHVAVRHRNHAGVMTAAPVTFLPGQMSVVDFALPATPTWGVQATKNVNGTMVLWAGNAVNDKKVKYTGANNDRDPILTRVGGTVPTATTNGYWPEDHTLDGVVKYTGVGNDRNPILINVGGTVPTAVRTEQLP